MKGILNKTEQGWVITYDEVIVKKTSAIPIGKIAFISKLYDSNKGIPLIDNGHIDGLKLYDSNEGLEVDFEIVTDYDNTVPDHFTKFARILTPEEAELKDWDVTLNDGLEDEPYEYIEDTTPREKAKKLVDKCGGEIAALIAVDEIIKECYNWNGSDNVQWETNRFDYWNEVKQEIEKL